VVGRGGFETRKKVIEVIITAAGFAKKSQVPKLGKAIVPPLFTRIFGIQKL
jgi:hypothetical protein